MSAAALARLEAIPNDRIEIRTSPARGRGVFARHTLDLIAAGPIEPGDEVTIDYGCALWFEPRD